MTGLIAHVVGARPNFVKAAPVVAALGGRARQILIHTGQHYDRGLSEVFFEDLGMPRPDVDLGVGSGSHAEQTGALLVGLETTLREHRPALVVAYGDVNSTFAAALTAARAGIPVAHVEAGLRSFDRSMPEEINRVLTDALADLLFATSPEALDHLSAEGVSPDRVHFVGNPMIDTLLRFSDAADPAPVCARLGIAGPYGVVTLHRPSNVDDRSVAAGIVRALGEVSSRIPLVFPAHPRGLRTLAEEGLTTTDRLRVIEPVGYLDFLALMKGSRLVLTDSGGIQEETTMLGVPCLTLRTTTERPITVSNGTNRLVGTDPSHIVETARAVLEAPMPQPGRPPLWDGSAGTRIADIVVGWLGAAGRSSDG